jgi:hypothetical protein
MRKWLGRLQRYVVPAETGGSGSSLTDATANHRIDNFYLKKRRERGGGERISVETGGNRDRSIYLRWKPGGNRVETGTDLFALMSYYPFLGLPGFL